VYGAGIQLATPDAITDLLGDTMTEGMDVLLAADPAKAGLKYLQENPRVAANINAGMGIAELMLPKAMLDPVKRAISSLKNYIPNWYGPEIKALKDMPTGMKNLTSALLKYKVKGVTNSTEAFALAQKMSGMASWVKDGFKGGVNAVFSPASRALYDKHGINSASQKTVVAEQAASKAAKARGDALKAAGEPRKVYEVEYSKAARHKEKAVAQINYNKLITVQSGRTAQVSQAMDSVMDAVSYGGIQDNTKANFIASAKLQKNTITGKTKRSKDKPLVASDADLGYAYDAAQKLWGIKPDAGNKLVVKRTTGVGGNHNSDAAGMKNKTITYVKRLYTELGTSDPMEIYTHIMSLAPELRNKHVNVLNPNAADVAINGLWFSSSQVGSAVVEGGVNVITKIMPNKRAMSSVSDVHDFGENLPVVGPVVGKALPNAEFSMTPFIHSDLRTPDIKKKSKNNKVSLDEGQGGRVSDATIEAYTSARPSGLDVAKQIPKMAGQAFVLGNGLFDYPTEQEY